MEKEFKKYIDNGYVVFSVQINQVFHEITQKYKKKPFQPKNGKKSLLKLPK